MKTKRSPLTGSKGFSLVELLVVIAVIAIIAAIAIPNILNITGSATDAKAKQNAANLVSMAASARASGYTTDWTNAAGAVAVLTSATGVTTGSGAGVMTFQMSIPAADTGTLAHYLTISGAGPDALVLTNN